MARFIDDDTGEERAAGIDVYVSDGDIRLKADCTGASYTIVIEDADEHARLISMLDKALEKLLDEQAEILNQTF